MPYVDDLPLKSQIFEAWKDRLGELGFFIDWGSRVVGRVDFITGRNTTLKSLTPDGRKFFAAGIVFRFSAVISFRVLWAGQTIQPIYF